MKYFTYDLITAANDWVAQTEEQQRIAEERFWRVVGAYYDELEELKPRLSKASWNFFRRGFAEIGLHDSRLLSFSVGDGLDYIPDGASPFRLNRQKALARVEMLDYEQLSRHVFELRGLKQVRTDLYVEENSNGKSIGDAFTYELTAGNEGYLRLGFLFATGGEIEIEFAKLIYRRHRIQRQYEMDQVYA